MAENLKNTILLEGKEYNINAVRSETAETADKTQCKLTLKASTTSGVNTAEFDGSESKEFNYVPPTGGKFTGPTYINSPTGTDLTAESIINSGQVDNRIVDLTGSPLCVWDTNFNPSNLSANLYMLKYGEDKAYSFTTVTGTESDFYLFKDTINGAFSTSNTDLTYSLYVSGSPSAGIKVSRADSASGLVVVPAKHNFTYNNETYERTVYAIDNGVFSQKASITGVVISQGVRIIGQNCFNQSKNLKYVIIPDSVEQLGGKDSDNRETSNNYYNRCFYKCSSLQKVLLGTGIKSIGRETFQDCISLMDIVIPANVTTVGVSAFSGCTSLASIFLPAGLTSIADNAFSGCTNLKTIYYAGSEEDWNKITISSTGNDQIINATKVYNYTYTKQMLPSLPSAPIDINTIGQGPFIYICKDNELTSAPVSNKVFLKLPNNDQIIEISKGAVRLENSNTATGGYYTYEGLAEIIAKINKRLEGIGGETLKVKDTQVVNATILDVSHDLIPDDNFNPDSVPTVQELDAKIEDRTTYNNPDPVLRAVGGISVGESLVKSYEDDGITPKEYYSVKEILTKMLYPYTSPIISWDSISATDDVRKKGTEVSVTQAKVTVTKKTNELASIAIYRKNKTGALASSSINASGGTVTLTFNDTISGDKAKSNEDTYEYFVEVTDNQGKITTSSSKVFTFVHPYYYGVINGSITEITDSIINELVDTAKVKGTYSQIYTTKNSRPVYAYPASYGTLTSIKDPNNFTQAWDCKTVTIDNISYYVYIGSTSTASSVKYTFNI